MAYRGNTSVVLPRLPNSFQVYSAEGAITHSANQQSIRTRPGC
jgi:hypothetical protein